jgi:hypothetical protein
MEEDAASSRLVVSFLWQPYGRERQHTAEVTIYVELRDSESDGIHHVFTGTAWGICARERVGSRRITWENSSGNDWARLIGVYIQQTIYSQSLKRWDTEFAP